MGVPLPLLADPGPSVPCSWVARPSRTWQTACRDNIVCVGTHSAKTTSQLLFDSYGRRLQRCGSNESRLERTESRSGVILTCPQLLGSQGRVMGLVIE